MAAAPIDWNECGSGLIRTARRYVHTAAFRTVDAIDGPTIIVVAARVG